MPHTCYVMHPAAAATATDGCAHGVLFLNSNGMDVVLNKTSVTFKYGGGGSVVIAVFSQICDCS